MPKITADVPEDLFRFLRDYIFDQRMAGVRTTVSTVITGILSKWKRDRSKLLSREDGNTPEERELTGGETPYSIDRVERAFSVESTGEEIQRLISSAELTTDEAEQVGASLVRITQELLELTEMIRKK